MKNKVLVVLGSGGHTSQIIRLLNLMGNKYKYEYLVQKEDKLSSKKIKYPGKVFYVNSPHRFGDNILVKVIRTLRTSWQSLFVLLDSDSEVLLSAGPGVAVPISIMAKIFGKKVIFLESWSRVYNKSSAGKLVYPFADLFFVQWKELKEKYPNAVFAGRLG